MRSLCFALLVGCGDQDTLALDTIYDRLGAPLASTEVLIIGAGGSGLAAGWAAREAGADLLILEREAEPGGGSRYGSFLWGAGTATQAANGVSDTPEAALAEWAEFTGGGDPTDPLVEDFVYASSDVIDWLTSIGMRYPTVASDEDAGTVERLHQQDGTTMPVDLLSADLADEIWLNTTATGLETAWGQVIGAAVQDTVSGEEGWIEADAVVVATGGFGRNLDRVREAWPEVDTDAIYYECWPGMDGSGLALIEGAGGQTFLHEQLGGYVHSTPDPRDETGREVLVVMGVQNGIFVDGTAQRVVSEAMFRSMRLADLEREVGQLYAIFGAEAWSLLSFQPPDYTEDMGSDRKLMTPDQLADQLGMPGYETSEALAAGLGLDAETLDQTITHFNEMAEAGEDTDFGRDIGPLVMVEAPYFAVPLTLATAKSFGGARIDETGAVLSTQGDVIPGLYAAGEAAGMLGSTSGGRGFSGALTAVYYTGLLSGQHAAERARTTD